MEEPEAVIPAEDEPQNNAHTALVSQLQDRIHELETNYKNDIEQAESVIKSLMEKVDNQTKVIAEQNELIQRAIDVKKSNGIAINGVEAPKHTQLSDAVSHFFK